MGHRVDSSSLCSYRSLSPKVPAHCPPLQLSPTILICTCPRFCPSCQSSWSWAACSIAFIFFIAFLLIVFLLESVITTSVARSHSFNMAALHNDFQGGFALGVGGLTFRMAAPKHKNNLLSLFKLLLFWTDLYIYIILFKSGLWSYICGFFSALFSISA